MILTEGAAVRPCRFIARPLGYGLLLVALDVADRGLTWLDWSVSLGLRPLKPDLDLAALGFPLPAGAWYLDH